MVKEYIPRWREIGMTPPENEVCPLCDEWGVGSVFIYYPSLPGYPPREEKCCPVFRCGLPYRLWPRIRALKKLKRKKMKLNPLSWFSDWAEKLGIPVWVVWAVAIGVGFLLFSFITGG